MAHSKGHLKKAKKFLTSALVFHTPIKAVSAHGLYVQSSDKKTYMDLASGLAASNIGHTHVEVIKAVTEQAKNLIHSGCIFHYDSILNLAEKLASITPQGIEKFFFSNSGAEAVEGAVKLARYTTGRQGVISFLGGFHGRTFGAMTLTTSSARYRKAYHPLLPEVYHAPYPYCFRCPMGATRKKCRLQCFSYLETMLKRELLPEEVACMIIEPVLGEGGYCPAPVEFLQKLRELCSEHGILLIFDEVQSGFGRTGKWFAGESYGVRPDIITLAKGIASGFPLSAVGASKKIMSNWPPGAHGTTFGGNPVACAASLATINVIEKQGLLRNTEKLGRIAIKELKKIARTRPYIGDVRGMGLMIGVEFIKKDGSPDRSRLKKIMERCLEKGLILIECGVDKNVARLIPPLNITKAELLQAIKIFKEALT
ncbi:MAG: aspartate aminotransferase family protein [Thermodesulfobacteriota bacterium]